MAFPFLHLPGFSLLGPYHGICGLFVVSAPGKLCINACLYRLIARGSLPADVPPALIQMTGKRTFAKLAVNLCLVNQCKGPSKCRRALHQQAFYRIPRIVQEQTLWTPKGFIKVQLLRKKVSAVTAEDIMKFLISKDAAGKKKVHVRSCSSKTCGFPKRLAAGTINSEI